MNLFCRKTCLRTCFLSFNPVLTSCLKYCPEKSLFRNTCIDLYLRNKKHVRKPVFSRQVAELKFFTRYQLKMFFQERGKNRGRAEHPPIFLGEDDFGNNWIDLTQPATTLYLNDY